MESTLFLFCLFMVGFVYASVGHGGASGYLATMALFGVAPAEMKPSALLLNLFVSTVSFIQFYRAGHFRWDKFWPFAVASVPLAFVGATIPLSDTLYRQLLAGCLLLVIVRLLWTIRGQEEDPKPVPLTAGLGLGGSIGLLSGMLGIGGGIILSPLMLLFRWARLKETAATSALFIFVNSLSGLFGLLSKGYSPSPALYGWIGAAFVGGLLGGYFGSHRFTVPTLRYLLAFGIGVACVKLITT
ncbi:sulfite exporter TauE/SafE family protein [Fibrisoma montanum]|uniref:Probable membrane transporter protein n=1 Tax=Fibrisoma montanum TaxID=2305895 RepID=A0A418M0V5_9BACT|nr:sulfite exporter TauE/SafE family protein [Fibrisoma montanum]RIV19297.1 sulfite exporter TauE/SafE family protein [Fibrisoma montanum]